MQVLLQRLRRRQILLIISASLMAIALVAVSTARFGIGLSPDSVGYIGVARNLLAGRGVVSYEGGGPFVVQPPLYPIVLAVSGGAAGVDPLAAARWLHAALYGAIVLLGGLLTMRVLGAAPLLIMLGVWSALVAPPLVDVAVTALSEPLFIVWLLLALWAWCSYRERGGWGALMLAAGATALACLTRYVGVTLIFAGWLIILSQRGRSRRLRTRQGLVFTVCAAAPLAAWLMRNYLRSGAPVGPRYPSAFTLADNLSYLGGIMGRWWLPLTWPEDYALWMWIGFAIGVIILALRAAPQQTAAGRIGPLLIVSVVYVAFLLATSTTTAFDRINDRLLAPLLTPLVLLWLSGLSWAAKRIAIPRLGALFFVPALFWLVYSTTMTVEATQSRFKGGAGGYNRTGWRQSETIAYLLDAQPSLDCPLYSNAPDALYILAGREAQMSPAHTVNNSPTVLAQLDDLRGVWPPEGGACLVWLTRQERSYLFTAAELLSVVKVEATHSFADGAIYIVRR